MSIGKKIANKAEAVKGAAKKFFGRATGNTRLRTEGRVDQFKGNTKQAGARSNMPSNTDPPGLASFSLPGAVGSCVRQRSTSPARPYLSISTIWRIHGPHI